MERREIPQCKKTPGGTSQDFNQVHPLESDDMKIRQFSRQNEVTVIAIYKADYGDKMENIFLVIPYDGYEGLISVAESECEITDTSLDGYRMVKNSSQRDMIVLSIVLENDLLDRMIDHDEVAMRKFHQKLSTLH